VVPRNGGGAKALSYPAVTVIVETVVGVDAVVAAAVTTIGAAVVTGAVAVVADRPSSTLCAVAIVVVVVAVVATVVAIGSSNTSLNTSDEARCNEGDAVRRTPDAERSSGATYTHEVNDLVARAGGLWNGLLFGFDMHNRNNYSPPHWNSA